MGYALDYLILPPDAGTLASGRGPVLVEFGAPWCGHCQRAQPLLREALASRPAIRHLKVEDAYREPLGRAYDVESWPTLVCLLDGQERGRVVRPRTLSDVLDALATIDGPRGVDPA